MKQTSLVRIECSTEAVYRAEDTRTIQHYQFTSWHDYATPDRIDYLLDFIAEVRLSGLLNNHHRYGPVIVHCSAGIGRTGTFVLVDATLAMVSCLLDHGQRVCLQLAKTDAYQQDVIDPNRQLLRYRRARVGLVQTPYQLEYAWSSICAAIEFEHCKWAHLMHSAAQSPSTTTKAPMLHRSAGNSLTASPEAGLFNTVVCAFTHAPVQVTTVYPWTTALFFIRSRRQAKCPVVCTVVVRAPANHRRHSGVHRRR
jgi:predicted protein tyrosine phosphatase